MKTIVTKNALIQFGLLTYLCFCAASNAQDAVAGETSVKQYIDKQKAAGIQPKDTVPGWKAGFTCNDLKKASVENYQECRYYYSVNGRYYPR